MKLRLATQEDCDLLFELANDEECRKNSFSQEKIEYDTHTRWFRARLQDEKSDLFLAIEGMLEVGMLRLDYKENQAIISYAVAAQERQKGYSREILRLAEVYVREHRENIQTMIGKVKKENVTSMHKFEELGYEKQECGEFVKYIKFLYKCAFGYDDERQRRLQRDQV